MELEQEIVCQVLTRQQASDGMRYVALAVAYFDSSSKEQPEDKENKTNDQDTDRRLQMPSSYVIIALYSPPFAPISAPNREEACSRGRPGRLFVPAEATACAHGIDWQ